MFFNDFCLMFNKQNYKIKWIFPIKKQTFMNHWSVF